MFGGGGGEEVCCLFLDLLDMYTQCEEWKVRVVRMELLPYSDTAGAAHPPMRRHPSYGSLLVVTMFVLKSKTKRH